MTFHEEQLKERLSKFNRIKRTYEKRRKELVEKGFQKEAYSNIDYLVELGTEIEQIKRDIKEEQKR